MKKIYTAIMVCAAAFALASCSGGSDKPEKVADAFLKAYLQDVDSKEMLKYVDQTGAEEIQSDFVEPEEQSPEFYAIILGQIKALKIQHELKEVNVQDTTATATFIITSKANPDFKADDAEVTLVKGEDKKWKVHEWDVDINIK